MNLSLKSAIEIDMAMTEITTCRINQLLVNVGHNADPTEHVVLSFDELKAITKDITSDVAVVWCKFIKEGL